MRVLFIGNSYTYVNNVPALVEAVAASAGGRAIDAEMLVVPGATLADFVEAGTVLERLSRESWDAVVLQELGGHLACLSSGQRPAPVECTASVAAHRKLARAARERGAEVVVFGTWSMTEGVQGIVSKGTRRIAGTTRGKAVDVGWMLERARRQDPALELFHPDKHLKPTGSVLAAVALFEALTGRAAPAGAFHAEVPVWPDNPGFSLRRYVSELERRLPEPRTLVVDVPTAEMATLVAATRLER
ncbi:MAG TPA: hypothetical protein VFO79_04020 [Xanthomonadales bacterium]|nr:hypothetical protein [Xanthomonadales bacterium]